MALAQPWRAFTAAWVHWSPQHLLLNLLALTTVAALGWAARLPRSAALAWLLAWPLTHLVLVVVQLPAPVPTHYGGLSGVLHAGAGIVGVWLVTMKLGKAQAWIGYALLALLAVKLGAEMVAGPRLLQGGAGTIAFASVPQAHLAGALAGLAAAVLVLAATRLRHASNKAPR